MPQSMDEFFAKIYRDNDARIVNRRDIAHDRELFVLNKSTEAEESNLIERFYSEDHPILFIVGTPRSGTTLLSQLLLDTCNIGHITNCIARYWMTPVYGTMLYWNPAHDVPSDPSSALGNTTGAHGPSEFGWFWQWWMNHEENDELTQEQLEAIPWTNIRKELYSVAGFMRKPLLIKSLVYTDYKIEKLSTVFPNSLFVWCRRDPYFSCQSIYESRIRQYGNPDTWWSIRPRNILDLQRLPPLEQVVRQWCQTNDSIAAALDKLDKKRWAAIEYEKMVSDPDTALNRIASLLEMPIEPTKQKAALRSGDTVRLDRTRDQLLRALIKEHVGIKR